MFVIIGGLVVLLLTAALVAPLFVDWTNYRAQFEAEASKILGRPVTVAGAASARLLPFPSVTFEDVRVGENKAKPILTMDRFSMDAELAPFLSGEVLIFDMRVTGPHAVVTIGADGAVDWALRPDAPFNAAQVRIENLVIEGGRVDVADLAAGTSHVVEIGRATVSARAISGPWRVNADVRADGEPMLLQASTGQLGDDGILPLRLQLFPTNHPLVIEADGNAKSEQGKVSYDGTFQLRPSALTDPGAVALRGSDGQASQVEDTEVFRVTGKFDLASQFLALPEFRLETGAREDPYVADGRGSITFGAEPRFDLNVDGTQVSFNDKGDKVTKGDGTANRIAAFRSFVDRVPVPEMPGNLAVKLPAIVAGGTTIREVAFVAEPQSGSWRVHGFTATLPGRTKLEADGLLSRGDTFGFKGKLLVASSQPAGLANWLTGEVDPAIRRLSAAGFSADADINNDTQQFDNLEVAIGTSSLKGAATRRTDGERPSLQLVLKGEALDLDALGALAAGVISDKGANRLGGHDLSLVLDAGPVTAGDIEAQALGVSVRLKQDRADFDRLMISQIAGASISATGTVSDFPQNTAVSLDAAVVSVDGSQFVSMLAEKFPDSPAMLAVEERVSAIPDLLQGMQMSVVAATAPDGDKRAFSLSGNIKADSGDGSFSANVKGTPSDLPKLDGTFQASLRQNEPLNFLTLAGVSLVPLGTPGPATLEFNGKGSIEGGLVVDSTYAADGTSATLSGTLQGLDFDGKFGLLSNDLDPYLMSTGVAFPGTGLGTSANFASTIKMSGNMISFAGLGASIGDNQAKGDIKLTLAERNRVDGTLDVNALDLSWLMENLTGAGTFSSVAPAATFSTEPNLPVDGRVAITSQTALLGPLGETGPAKATLVMQPNALRLEGFETALAGGVLAGNFEARNDNGEGAASGDFTIKSARLEALTGREMVTAAVDISGSIAAGGKSAEGLSASLGGSGVISLMDGSINGINPQGFASVIQTSDKTEKAPLETEVMALLTGQMLQGKLPFANTQLAWTAAGGKVRMSGFRAAGEGITVTADIDADVALATAEAKGAISYDAGGEALTGAETIVPYEVTLSREGASFKPDPQPISQYLTQRALEREQARVEAMQAALIEKQRLRRDARTLQLAYADRASRSLKREEAVRNAARSKGELTRQLWEAEKSRLALEAEAKRQAEADALREAEAKARAEAESKAAAEATQGEASKSDFQKPVAPVAPGFDSLPGVNPQVQQVPELPKLDLRSVY